MQQNEVSIYYLAVMSLIIFSSSALCSDKSFQVKREMKSGNTKWTSMFDIDISKREILIHMKISLLPTPTVNRVLLEKNILSWGDAIDSVWNKYFFVIIEGEKIPIIFKIKFTHFKPHHRVVIHSAGWAPNQHNWYINMPPKVVAHEIGHMLGAYDEYRGGALSYKKPVIDTSSIMGSKLSASQAYPRHLALLEHELVNYFENNQLKVVRVTGISI
ncbi:MAG: hypothetical protein HN791_10890 [Gammaproteobacteria bacterium]|jgi:hypothetical protein|nr:hypothetical protein [Gammaproteobacteria bacterium]